MKQFINKEEHNPQVRNLLEIYKKGRLYIPQLRLREVEKEEEKSIKGISIWFSHIIC